MINFKARSSRQTGRTRFTYHPAASGRMVKLDVHHRDGGGNPFSGRTEKRGIEIGISTIELSDAGNGVMIESSSPMDDCNLRILLEETSRYSAAKVERIARALDAKAPDISTAWATDRDAAIDIIHTACGIQRPTA